MKLTDIPTASPELIRFRLEDAIKALDAIGLPEMDSPAERIRALGAELAKRVQLSEQVLDKAVSIQEEMAGSQMLQAAMWQPFPDVEPPTNRDVYVLTDQGKQVVVRWDQKPAHFFTTCGTRIWINHVTHWREMVEVPGNIGGETRA